MKVSDAAEKWGGENRQGFLSVYDKKAKAGGKEKNPVQGMTLP